VARLVADRERAEAIGHAARATVEATATVDGFAARLLSICEEARARP
jgi:hypothetical protein